MAGSLESFELPEDPVLDKMLHLIIAVLMARAGQSETTIAISEAIDIFGSEGTLAVNIVADGPDDSSMPRSVHITVENDRGEAS